MQTLHHLYGGARNLPRSIWARITNTAFLTLVIALSTLATAYVTYQNGRVTAKQVELLRRQVDLNAAETRPFVRLKPSLSSEGKSRAFIDALNLGPVPARIIAYDMVVQVGANMIKPNGGAYNTGDILYAGQKGLGVFLELTGSQINPFKIGLEPIVVGGCVVYAPVTAGDIRRWKVSTAYRFVRGDELPLGLFTDEVTVRQDASTCDASGLRNQWEAQLKLHPR
jgi:hypothetical protein